VFPLRPFPSLVTTCGTLLYTLPNWDDGIASIYLEARTSLSGSYRVYKLHSQIWDDLSKGLSFIPRAKGRLGATSFASASGDDVLSSFLPTYGIVCTVSVVVGADFRVVNQYPDFMGTTYISHNIRTGAKGTVPGVEARICGR
jgi:hypothetical protein